MRCCIPIESDQGLDSVPFGHFGSAPMFMICDTDQGVVEIIDNSDQHHVHGACIPMNALNGRQVDAIIVGGIGMRAIMGLNQSGIKVYQSAEGTVKDNVDRLKNGTLKELTTQDACGQHGHGGGGCHG